MIANESYNLGGGKLYFAQKNTDGSHTDFFYFGRTDDDLKLTLDIETLEHPNTEGNIEEIDFEIETKKQFNMNITTDDMTQAMVARFFRGESAATAQVGATLTAEDQGAVKQGGIYETGFIAFDDMELKTGATPYIEGTDYSVDLGAGTFSIIEGGGIADDTVIDVTGTYQTISYDTVEVGTKTKLEGKFKFISDQTTGTRVKALIHKTSIIPSGDFALKGTKEWKKCSFDVKVLKDESIVAVGESKYMKIEEIAA